MNYRLTISQAQVVQNNDSPEIKVLSEEQRATITCSFITPYDHTKHSVTCKTNLDKTAVVDIGDIDSGNKNSNDFQLFAGHRSDTFFFNKDWTISLMNKGVLIEPKNSNIMDQLNVLSVVMEIDTKVLFDSPSSLLAVTAESVTYDVNPFGRKLVERRLDRLGRPEITNVSLVAHEQDDLRDAYNTQDVFSMPKDSFDRYSKRLYDNIVFYDQADGRTDWSIKQRADFSKILTKDYLVLDMTKPCSGGNDFLEIEKSLLNGSTHKTCGGRRINDDFMDTLFTLFINADQGVLVSDGVDRPYKEVSTMFPYLVEPDFGFFARMKAKLARFFF